MDGNEWRDAELICWIEPTESLGMVLIPITDRGGSIRVRIDAGAVEIQGVRCLYRTQPRGSFKTKEIIEKQLVEIHMTIPLARCQITWKYVEPAEEK